MMVGVWQYPVNPKATIPGFTKPQPRMKASDLLKAVPRLNTDFVHVDEKVALKLAEKSPNPQRATNAVYLLSANSNLNLLPFAALMFASALR